MTFTTLLLNNIITRPIVPRSMLVLISVRGLHHRSDPRTFISSLPSLGFTVRKGYIETRQGWTYPKYMRLIGGTRNTFTVCRDLIGSRTFSTNRSYWIRAYIRYVQCKNIESIAAPLYQRHSVSNLIENNHLSTVYLIIVFQLYH